MDLLIVGASVRAAAHSALRAGLRPVAIDRFADEDLKSRCPTRHADSYPQGLLRESGRAGPDQLTNAAWMYTGGLENFPAIIDAISTKRRLLGNSGDVVRVVRDPWKLAATLASRSFRVPELRRDELRPVAGTWLRKPFRSGGGNGIHRLTSSAVERRRPGRRTHYLQQYISGPTLGAVFVAANHQAELLGVTAQLVGSPWAGAEGFQYVGSIGPLLLPTSQQQSLMAIGNYLAEQFHLIGLFGIDFILCDRELWTLEVNPRYTASVEILERALGVHALQPHVDACTQQKLPTSTTRQVNRLFGKATVYARCTFPIANQLSTWIGKQNESQLWPQVADIPPVESIIEHGQPICTVFAEGEEIETVESRLKELTAKVHSFGEELI
jgi:predicted ATP-grasp superfamily ATP-dependent carboligase